MQQQFQPQRRPFLALAGLPLAALLAPRHALAQEPGIQDESWTDSARRRAIPVRLRWPVASSAQANSMSMVLFTHGLGGSRDGGAVWGEAWANAGFVVLHLQHPGSDIEAMRSTGSRFTNPAALRRLGSAQQLMTRLQDVGFVLDEIGRRSAAGQGRWAGVRAQEIGLCGHSFGAYTALGMAGQRYPGFSGVSEPRLAAFIALSPSPPANADAVAAFARITRPVLCITGSRDSDVAGTGATPHQRVSIFDALPASKKSQLVLEDADHLTFAGQTGRSAEIIDRQAVTRRLQPQHQSVVASITTDWWRTHLLRDAQARNRLTQPPELAAGDRWQTG